MEQSCRRVFTADGYAAFLQVSCRAHAATAIQGESVCSDHQATDKIGSAVVPHCGRPHADTRREAQHETAMSWMPNSIATTGVEVSKQTKQMQTRASSGRRQLYLEIVNVWLRFAEAITPRSRPWWRLKLVVVAGVGLVGTRDPPKQAVEMSCRWVSQWHISVMLTE